MAANKRISELTAGSALDGSELVPVAQGGATVRVTAQDLADLAVAGTYAGLTDATTADLPGLNVPLQAALAAKADVSSAASGTYLLVGGGVGFTSGLALVVSAATYVIGGTQYSSGITTLNASAADPTNPRIDVVVVNTSGVASIIAGTPGVNPEKPDVDPETQLELTFFVVAAGATALDVVVTDVYHENTEYTVSQSGTAFAFAGTTNPNSGTVCVDGTAVASGNYVQFQAPSNIDPADFDNLVFYIRSKATWAATKTLAITLRATNTLRGVTVTLGEGAFGFTSSNVVAYQQIVVPMSLFGAGGLAVNRIRFACVGAGAAIGFYLDDITLQAGLAATADLSRMRWRGAWSATAAYAVNDVVLSASTQYVAIAGGVNQTPASSPTYWTASSSPGTGGSVTSVAATVPAFLSVAGSPVTTTGTLAITYSGTALPEANGGTGLTALGAGVATFLGTPSSANLAAAVTGETGTGALVFDTSPTLVTPALGTPSALVLTNATGLPVAGGGTGVATLTAYAPVFGGTTGTGAVQSGTVGTAGQVLTSNGAGALPTMQTQPFDVHAFYPGIPTASAKILRVPVGRAVGFVADFVGSYFKASANATASTVFDVQKNGSSIGTVTIAAGGTTATFVTSGGAAQTFAAGDLLAIIAPASPDATLADPGFVLVGTR